jgi:hypothetical protein
MRVRIDMKSPVREYRPPGSVRGAPGNRRPHLDDVPDRNPDQAALSMTLDLQRSKRCETVGVLARGKNKRPGDMPGLVCHQMPQLTTVRDRTSSCRWA